MLAEENQDHDHYYSVDKYKKVVWLQRSRVPPKGIKRIAWRVRLEGESFAGFLSSMLGIPIMFGGLFAVLIGVFYGPFVFLGTTGLVFSMMALYLNRKVGKSLQFGDSAIGWKILAQVLGSILVLALMAFIFVVLPRII